MVAFYNAADQELYKKYQYLPQEKYRLGFTAPNTEVQKIENTFGIPATNAFTGGNQNNNYYTGPTSSLVSGFNQAITDRQNRLEALNMPLEQKGVPGADIVMENLQGYVGQPDDYLGLEEYNEALSKYSGMEGPQTIKGATGVYQAGAKPTIGRKISDFVYGLPGFNKPQSARDILESGYTGTGSGPGLMAALLGKLDRYGSLPRSDQAFISSRMGYTGPTIFGANTTGLSTDPFGINTRSAFGNYADYTKNRAEELNNSIEKSKDKWENADWNETGSLDAIHPEYGKTWAEMNKMNLEMQEFYNQGAKDLKNMEEEEYQNRIDNFVKNYSRPGVKDMFDTVYDGVNIHGGDNKTGGTTTTTGSGDGFTGSGDFSNIDNSGKDYGPHSKGDGNKSSGGFTSKDDAREQYGRKDGGRIGYFYGGLASIL